MSFLVIGQQVLHLSGESLVNVACSLKPAHTCGFLVHEDMRPAALSVSELA